MVQETPLVSVIIPTYERPDFLKTAVESVLDQTYDPIELIVVDDGSKTSVEASLDGIDTADLLDFRLLEHEENKGQNAARATGISASTGDLVAFLDDDDRYLRRKVARQVNLFRAESSDVGLTYCGSRNRNETRERSPTVEGDVTRELLLHNFVGGYSSVMVHRKAIEDVGLPDPRFPMDDDWEWFLRLSRSWEFASIPEPLVERGGGANADYEQVSGSLDRKRTALPLLLEKFGSLAATYGWRFERRWRAELHFRIGWIAVMTDQPGIARRYTLRAIRYYPFVPRYHIGLMLALFDRPLSTVYSRLPRQVRRAIGQAIRW
ncbi:glycosyltransferase family 2 protein [Halorussus salinisoli]|uniref:glycosyltransferase family 2 protein n=1 Tax=Halorussus salinisoli TaxID=2558242 RepID=UPI0010C201A1|nr:glycosyltransferase family 2 protein [Halorussus salinisoli]